MRKKIGFLRKLVLVAFMVFVYCFALLRSLNEASRRSLQLRDDTDTEDHIVISMFVTAVNPSAHELTAQISLRPQGILAQDEVTPAVNLKLLTNNVRSQQEFDFPKGQRMNRIEAVFPLNGELNRYPFDRYETTLWILMTTPARKKQPQSPQYSGKRRRAGGSGRCRHECLATEHRRSTYGYFVCINPRAQVRRECFSGKQSKSHRHRTENQARRQCDRCFYSSNDVDECLSLESAGDGAQGHGKRAKNQFGSANCLDLADFRLAGAAERPAWRPGCGSLRRLRLLHLGRNYRGVVGHHYHMEVAAALR